MRARAAMVMAAAVVLGACGGAEDEQEPMGYVLLDLEAQEAGFRLDGVLDIGLPASFAHDEAVELVGPETFEVLEPEPGELWYVRGADGAVERYAIGDEVEEDAVYVVGSERAAVSLAKRIDGEVEQTQQGVWRLEAPHALVAFADSVAPSGLEELVPLESEAVAAQQDQQPSVWAGAEVAGHALRGAVSGQRFGYAAAERLPIAQLMSRQVKCADPVEGLWVSRRFDPTIFDWHLFTMEVRRDSADPSKLQGRIRTRNWSGTSDETAPGVECATMGRASYGHRFDLTVEMTAEGTFDGKTFSFQGANWHERARRCGPYGQWYRYHHDHFTGVVLEDGKTIDAVNNDGARAFDEAHTLQRVGCL